MSVLSYAKSPAEKGSPEKNITLYGERVARIYKQRGEKININEDGNVIVPSVNKTESKL